MKNGMLMRDKVGAETKTSDPNAKITMLNKQDFQHTLSLDLLKLSGRIQDGNTELNVKILAEMYTIILHLADINKIPLKAVETVYSSMSNQYGVYNARLFFEEENQITNQPKKQMGRVQITHDKEKADKDSNFEIR